MDYGGGKGEVSYPPALSVFVAVAPPVFVIALG
jgi:hypothetical protein